MATTNSVTLTSNAPIPQFDLSNLGTFPQEILHNIFSNALNYKDIHSLLCTCHHFRWAISNWTPFWTTLLENHFPGFYTPSPNVKPIDTYKNCLELENTVRSGICKYYILPSNGHVRCIIEHEGNLIAANAADNIEIWKDDQLQKSFSLQNMGVINAMVAYKDKLFFASTDSMIQVYDLNSGELLKKLEGHRGEIFDLCKIENKLYSCSKDNTIRIWDMDTLEFMGTLEEHSEYKSGVTSLLPNKNTLYSGNSHGEISAWDLSTRKSEVFREAVGLDVDKMLIHGDKFISIDVESISVMNFISRQELFSDLGLPRGTAILGFGRLLFSSRNDGVSAITWDLNTGKKLMEHMFIADQEGPENDNWVSSSSLVFSEGKLYVASDEQAIHVFDFAEPIKYKKELERLTKVDGQLRTGEKFTHLHMQALQLAIAQKNRNEIIACIDNLIAVDPKNKEFCEFLCEVTQGISTSLYAFLERRDFDHREILRKLKDFDDIKTAADKFTERLKTDRDVVVSSIPFTQFHHIIESENED
jgi:WD40 repeat protein